MLSDSVPWPNCFWHRIGRSRSCSGVGEDVSVGARLDAVHGAGVEIHEDGARDEAAVAGHIVVDADAFHLEIIVS